MMSGNVTRLQCSAKIKEGKHKEDRIHAYKYIYIYLSIYLFIYLLMYLLMYFFTYLCMYVCMYVGRQVCMYVCVISGKLDDGVQCQSSWERALYSPTALHRHERSSPNKIKLLDKTDAFGFWNLCRILLALHHATLNFPKGLDQKVRETRRCWIGTIIPDKDILMILCGQSEKGSVA